MCKIYILINNLALIETENFDQKQNQSKRIEKVNKFNKFLFIDYLLYNFIIHIMAQNNH